MTTIQGVLHGQRCRTCQGAVRWRNAGFGERPSHIWAQDFADAAGVTHPAILEAGQPTHYWAPGVDGSPDVKVMEDTGEHAEERHVQGTRTDVWDVRTGLAPLPAVLDVTAADLADVPPPRGWEPVGTISQDTRPPHPDCATRCQEAEALAEDTLSCVGGCVYRDHPSYAAALAASGAYAANPPLTQEGTTDGE